MCDEYPTDVQLNTIRYWNANDLIGMMDYIRPLWKYADCGYWSVKNGAYSLSTGGWSGNEEIIGAMQENQVWWMMFWKSSMRGGHYIFERLRIS